MIIVLPTQFGGAKQKQQNKEKRKQGSGFSQIFAEACRKEREYATKDSIRC